MESLFQNRSATRTFYERQQGSLGAAVVPKVKLPCSVKTNLSLRKEGSWVVVNILGREGGPLSLLSTGCSYQAKWVVQTPLPGNSSDPHLWNECCNPKKQCVYLGLLLLVPVDSVIAPAEL